MGAALLPRRPPRPARRVGAERGAAPCRAAARRRRRSTAATRPLRARGERRRRGSRLGPVRGPSSPTGSPASKRTPQVFAARRRRCACSGEIPTSHGRRSRCRSSPRSSRTPSEAGRCYGTCPQQPLTRARDVDVAADRPGVELHDLAVGSRAVARDVELRAHGAAHRRGVDPQLQPLADADLDVAGDRLHPHVRRRARHAHVPRDRVDDHGSARVPDDEVTRDEVRSHRPPGAPDAPVAGRGLEADVACGRPHRRRLRSPSRGRSAWRSRSAGLPRPSWP